ncbi:hypothetical protein JD844_027974 [Phrynosoma platyrhinos]|uniref:Peptidase A1 domain-containing protein n=1 Tax=Phrynosoma platyrhinos TaxID=52577 RepID=A0ABQ7SH85_PHRPL|nr:hypothetical protein JD844_027974 [Phrynosoma platyrhinos]
MYSLRIPLVQFNSIRRTLRERGELDQFWRDHLPDVFAQKYQHCFPSDIFLSAGPARERLYDYMNVRLHQKFKSFLSQSYAHGGQSFSLQYGTGRLIGVVARDKLQVRNHISNITIEDQEFGESVFEPGMTFALAHFDGVLGLGYPSLSVTNALPVFDNIIKQHLVEEPVFSFFLKRSVF